MRTKWRAWKATSRWTEQLASEHDVRPLSRWTRLLNAYWPLWTLLVLPGAYWTYIYWQGTSFYGEYLHATGELAARLLIAAMAVTPLRLMFPNTALADWLLPRRRHLGVATFGYALLHTGAYIIRQPFARIVEEAMEIAMWTGWLAFLLMLALAVTSNDASERLMKHGWKALHRAVYAVALLTYAHWVLSAFNPVPGYIHLGVLAALESVRVWRSWTNRREAQEIGASSTM